MVQVRQGTQDQMQAADTCDLAATLRRDASPAVCFEPGTNVSAPVEASYEAVAPRRLGAFAREGRTAIGPRSRRQILEMPDKAHKRQRLRSDFSDGYSAPNREISTIGQCVEPLQHLRHPVGKRNSG